MHSPDRVDRIAVALEADPPEGFRGRYSREVWAGIVAAVLAAAAEDLARQDQRSVAECIADMRRADAADDERQVCAGCGDVDPPHWREGGWYCDGCAAYEVCQSPYCDEPEHRG